ncbi:MAG: copper resistance protein CopC [Solirubrobacterales bacterium]
MVIRSYSKILVPLCLAVLACLVLPGSAMAHAVLSSSSPTRGEVLESPPSEVSFEFNEPVEVSLGAIRIFDTEANQIPTGEIQRLGDTGEEIAVDIPADLDDGTYTATYRVVSADSHPISGGLVFTVGDASLNSGKTISELIALSDVGPVTEVAFWFDRWVGYIALAIAVGLISFLLLIWSPLSRSRQELVGAASTAVASRFHLVLGLVILAGLLASAFAIPLQGASAAGTSFWDSLRPEVLREVADTRYGSVMILRIVALLALIPIALAGRRLVADRELTRKPALVALISLPVLVLAVTPALAGHASTQHPIWLLTTSDILHVVAMSVWTGGLGALILLLPAATRAIGSVSAKTSVLTAFLLRFSTVALIAVLVIGISGTVQAVVEVNSFPALIDTAFGRAVLIKLVLFLILIAVAAKNRRRFIPALVSRRQKNESPGKAGVSIRRNLRIELILVTLVLAVTAALVSYPPPVAGQSGPVSGSVQTEGENLEYTVDPARVGSNEVHVYLFDDETGAPVEVRDLEMTFSLPDSDIAAIDADVRKAGPGHYVAPAAMLAVKGDWLAQAAVRFSRFDEQLVEFEVPIR